MRHATISVGVARVEDLYTVLLLTPIGPMFIAPADIEELMEDLEQQLQIIEMLTTQEARASRAMARRGSLAGKPVIDKTTIGELLDRLQANPTDDADGGVSKEKKDAPAPEPPGGEPDRGEDDPPEGWGGTAGKEF